MAGTPTNSSSESARSSTSHTSVAAAATVAQCLTRATSADSSSARTRTPTPRAAASQLPSVVTSWPLETSSPSRFADTATACVVSLLIVETTQPTAPIASLAESTTATTRSSELRPCDITMTRRPASSAFVARSALVAHSGPERRRRRRSTGSRGRVDGRRWSGARATTTAAS